MHLLRSQEYTIGWICALSEELAAARAMLDELHEVPRDRHKSDQNIYCCGRIEKHNIAIACLPAGVYGTTSAATVAAQMLSSFESIRIGLMVGIGGGVPGKGCDIRLGDVVVSKPGGTFGGVVQYDLGKTTEGGQFTRTGSLNKPPQILLNAVASLKAEHMVVGSKIPLILEDMINNHPNMRDSFSYQHKLNDWLFKASHKHKGNDDTCENCDRSGVVDRSNRSTSDPLIHYGVIASGNQVMKDSDTRDRLIEELGIICFEMEAAGLMDNFPCLVIRGICDYADTHKNKGWQMYAAATAAAYAKELLRIIPADQVEATLRAAEVMGIISENLTKIGDEVTTINKTLNSVQEDNYRQDVLCWLTPVDHAAQYSDFLTRRQEGTGLWLLNSPQFLEWLNGTPNTLFCPGIPGAGKTMMASIVVEHLWETFSSHKIGIAFLYCSYGRREEQNAVNLLSALLKQLVQEKQQIPEPVKALYDHHVKRKTRPLLDEISKSLHSIVKSYSRVFVVIDALDECKNDTFSLLLPEIRNLQTQSNTKLMATSRFVSTIMEEFENDINLEIKASDGDVERYLNGGMRRLPSFVRRKDSLQELIKTEIIRAVKGMFLLAQLHLDSLADKVTPAAIKSALAELPRGSKALDKAYEEAIKRINSQALGFRDLAKDVLSWIICAQRPLTAEELQHALAVEPGKQELDEDNIADINDIVSVCAGLVTVDPKTRIIRLVHYTTQEYFDRIRVTWVPDAPTNIATTCLTYLSFKTFASGSSPNDEQFEDRLAQNRFLSYAAGHWADHAREVQVKVKEVALPFLKNELLVSASNQVVSVSYYRHGGYSEGIQVTGLHLAARFDLQELLASLLEVSRDADQKDSNGRTPLSYAAEYGHEVIVRLLLEKAVDVDSKSTNSQTLVFPQGKGYGALAKPLFENAVDIDSKPISGRTPLSWAAENGHEAVVKLLLEKAADPDPKSSGRTPLTWAAKNGHEAVVKLLLEKTVDVDSKSDSYRQTPLSYAAQYGHEAVVKLLLEKAVDVNSESGAGLTPLSWAARKGHEAIVKLLLENSADVDAKNSSGQTPLLYAADNGHGVIVKLLLEKAIDVDSKDFLGRTPLSYAAKKGNEVIVKLLLEKAVDVDTRSSRYDRTPLSYAAEEGHETVVKLLLEKIVDVNSKDSDGRTPLSYAAANGHETVVKLLLKKAAGVDSKDSAFGRTPLSWAAKYGHEAIAKLLLEKAIDVDSRDSTQGQTPLLWAAENGHEAIVKLLLEKAVDVNPKDSYSRTPLSWAAENGHEAVVRLLLEKAVDVDSKDSYCRTSLSYAAEKGHEAVVELLLEKVVDVDSKDSAHDRTPLSWAAEKGHEAVVKLLLEKTINVNLKDSYGRTPLSYAAENGHEAVMKLLLEKAVDVNSKDSGGRTPLSWAAGMGHEVIVKLLLKAADVNSVSNNGWTPLSYAAENGHGAVVKLLLENAVDVDSESSNGRTPLSYAAGKGQEAVMKLLLEKDADVDSGSSNGRTPLSYAAGNGHSAIVKLLLEEAADVNSKDSDGRTPLLHATVNEHEAVVKLLLEKAVDADSKDSYGRTSLSYAAEIGYEAVVKLLLERAVDVDSKDSNGRTPLLWAAGMGHEVIVELLLEKAVDVDSKDSDGRTPLLFAVDSGHEAVVKLLLEKAIDIDSKDSDGRAPLSYAAERGHEVVVKLLLEKAVDVDSKDYDGRMPLSYAVENGHEIVVKLLLEKAIDVDSKDSNGRIPLSYAEENGHEIIVKLLQSKTPKGR